MWENSLKRSRFDDICVSIIASLLNGVRPWMLWAFKSMFCCLNETIFLRLRPTLLWLCNKEKSIQGEGRRMILALRSLKLTNNCIPASPLAQWSCIAGKKKSRLSTSTTRFCLSSSWLLLLLSSQSLPIKVSPHCNICVTWTWHSRAAISSIGKSSEDLLLTAKEF